MPIVSVVGALALFLGGYIWLSCRCDALGRELRSLESEKERLQNEYLTEEYKWMRMKSPREIEKALEKHNIMMTWPKTEQVIRLSDMNLIDEPLPAEDDEAIQFARIERLLLNE